MVSKKVLRGRIKTGDSQVCASSVAVATSYAFLDVAKGDVKE